MSKDKYKHAMEVIENWERVEIGFGYPERSWNEAKQSPDAYTLSQLNDRALFRIKPTHSKAPFGPEDIKAGMWFKLRSWAPGCRRLVIAVYNHGIHLGDDINTTITWDALLKDYSYSLDAITWHPCEKPTPPPPKREPRRVWVNFSKDERIAYLNPEYAKNMAGHLCSEAAVEFVEVLK